MILKTKLLRLYLFLRHGPYMTLDEFMMFTAACVLTIGMILAVLTIEYLQP